MPKSLVSNISYKKPERDDIAVGFTLFNYTGSSRLIMNYLYTVEKMKAAGIPVFTIEFVITGSKPTIADAFHVYGKSYLFLKENLFRILETKIPEKYTKLLFMDSDIIFEEPNWYNMLSDILETHDVSHCFETVKYLDITYHKVNLEAKTLIIADEIENTPILTDHNGVKYHSGFGWAFTRSWYNRVGYFDKAILGSGDAFFVYGLYGKKFNTVEKTTIYEKELNNWLLKFDSLPVISYLPVTVYHLFHGQLANRNYVKRHLLLNNIDTDIIKNEDGVFELTDETYNLALYEYFVNRKDDMIE
jgi:hypothetical protein